MPDLQEDLVDRANGRVMSMRREVVRTLAEAHEELMAAPARERDVIDQRTRRRLYALVSQRQVEGAIQDYEAVSELSGDASTQKEMLARAAQLRAFSESMKQGRHDHRPWLAAMSVTTAEVVRPETLPELRKSEEWGVMQQASLEATVSCMPPDPKNWAAADGEGLRRIEDLDADVAWWSSVDRPPESESELSSVARPTGNLLREAVGTRVKDSCERTDTDWETEDIAFSKAYEFDTRVFMESTGTPEDADLEEERFIETPASSVLDATSDWWALRSGIPVAIDSFPAPTESVQQQADVRVQISRQVWENTRAGMGQAFSQTVPGHDTTVSVVVGAQQRRDLEKRAESIKWTVISDVEDDIDREHENDPGADPDPERAEFRREAERTVSDYESVVRALSAARPVTENDSSQEGPGLKMKMRADEWARAMRIIGEEHVQVRMRPGTASRDSVGVIGAEDHGRVLTAVRERIEEVNEQHALAYDPFTEERPESAPRLDYGPSDSRWQQIKPLSDALDSLERAVPVPPRASSAESEVASHYVQPPSAQSADVSADLGR